MLPAIRESNATSRFAECRSRAGPRGRGPGLQPVRSAVPAAQARTRLLEVGERAPGSLFGELLLVDRDSEGGSPLLELHRVAVGGDVDQAARKFGQRELNKRGIPGTLI
jgi:hypothetical protein